MKYTKFVDENTRKEIVIWQQNVHLSDQKNTSVSKKNLNPCDKDKGLKSLVNYIF